MVWGGRREEGSGWGTHVYLWWIHFDIWQNKYNYVKFKNKIKLKKNKVWQVELKKKLNYRLHSDFPSYFTNDLFLFRDPLAFRGYEV